MRFLFLIILFAFLAVSGVWYWAAQSREDALEGWFAARHSHGWIAEYGDLNVRGYPSRLDIAVSNMSLADPKAGWLWETPSLWVGSVLYQPHLYVGRWPEQQTLATPRQRLNMDSRDGEFSIRFTPDSDFALDEQVTVLGATTLTSDQGWQASFTGANLAIRRDENDPRNYRLGARFLGLSLPESLRKQLVESDMPREFETLFADAALLLTAPLDRHALEQNSARPVGFRLDDFTAQWGPLDLRIKGNVDIAKDGTLDGRMIIRARNWRDMLELAATTGVISRTVANTARDALTLVAMLSGNKEHLELPLEIRSGTAFLGPLPLGPAPKWPMRQ